MKKKIYIPIIVLFLLGLTYYALPFFLSVEIKIIPESFVIYDTSGTKIGEIVKDNKYRHIESKIEDIPDFLKQALILLEDKSFYNNSGIDYIALFRAFATNIKKGTVVEGGSTISSQLIRNSYGLNEKRTINRKSKEFLLALALNKKYSKNEILEKYMNILYFGYMNYGFETASSFYFGKELKNLTKAEMIALLVIPKNSNIYNPITNKNNFQKRYNYLVDYFYENKLLDEKEYIYAKNENIIINTKNENKLEFVEDFIKLKYFTTQNKVGYQDLRKHTDMIKTINTNIDYNLTQEIKKLADSNIIKLYSNNVTDYGIIILERDTNNLKVMIGGENYNEKLNGQVNSTTSLRQVGSTMKVFTYLLAFQNLGLTPSDKILDLPVQYETIEGYSYTPQNYSLDYKGEVTIAESLSQSLNVPAIKIAEKVGVENLYNFVKQLGVSSLDKNSEEYGLALTLGVGEISLFELVRAYSLFAHNGEFCDINILEDETKYCKKIVDSKYTDMIEEILTNRYFKINSFPINSNLDFPDRYVFIKTGTSRNFRDNFAIGFTENYIIGVWVENKDASYMKGVSGVSGAGSIFKKIVYFLEKDVKKSNVVILEDKKEDYLDIIHPLDKSVFLIERFRPEESQNIKLEFNTNLNYDYKKWFINDIETKEDFIFLEKGKYIIKIELYLKGKKVGEDSSSVEVLEE